MTMKNDAKFKDEYWALWALECLKHLHFNGLLLTKVYNVWAKKYRVMFDDTEDWWKIRRKTDLYFLKWHEEFGKFSQAEK